MSTARSPTLALACELVGRESVTPADGGCQRLLAERLGALGFACRELPFGEVSNLWAERGDGSPTLLFAGHTDVVPPGPLEAWSSPPFEPSVREGMLYGRGAADMKGGLAAMVTACERFVGANPRHRGTIAFLVTSDEEGVAVDGTTRVVEWLREQGRRVEWCVVGEPSSEQRHGDLVRNGRRGSLGAELIVHGQQGHIAYPHLADNPIHRLARVAAELAGENWDAGNEYFPATTFQVSNVAAGTGADNVIPGQAAMRFNFRFGTASTVERLSERTAQIVARHAPHHELRWRLSGQPFLTPPGELTEALGAAIRRHTGIAPQLSTGGGTSDGRFIATLGTQVVELGPVNASIHKLDEHVRCADLDTLSEIYETLLGSLLPPGA